MATPAPEADQIRQPYTLKDALQVGAAALTIAGIGVAARNYTESDSQSLNSPPALVAEPWPKVTTEFVAPGQGYEVVAKRQLAAHGGNPNDPSAVARKIEEERQLNGYPDNKVPVGRIQVVQDGPKQHLK